MKISFTADRGSSIIEVLVATFAVGMVLTTVIIGMTFSLRGTAQSRLKALATKQGQEAMETFRRERDAQGFQSFKETLGGSGTRSYCLNDLPQSSTTFNNLESSEGCNGQVLAGTEFMRTAKVTISPSGDEIVVEIRVGWSEGATQRSSIIEQRFRRY